MTDSDRYKYFRIEARELVDALTRGLLDIERGSAGAEAVSGMLRFAHTLKGAARVVGHQPISELAHAIEDQLAPVRTAQQRVEAATITDLLRTIDAIGHQVDALHRPRTDVQDGPASDAAALTGLVRIDVDQIESVAEALNRLGSHVAALRHAAEDLVVTRRAGGAAPGPEVDSLLPQAVVDRLRAHVSDAERQLEEVRIACDDFRLVRSEAVFAALDRVARDASLATGRQVEFRTRGGEQRIDAEVLATIRGALIQIVRNAVTHGIETSGQRTRCGKPPVGLIEMSVERRGGQVTFTCADDGRGLDLEAIRTAAVRQGRWDASRPITIEDAIALLLEGRISTQPDVTEHSGRGVGLDVVSGAVHALKGTVAIRTDPGLGTAVEVTVPVSLALVEVLEMEAGGASALIPLTAVRRVLRIAESTVTATLDGDRLAYDHRLIPCVGLAALLPASGPCTPTIAVVIGGTTADAALAVTRLGRTRTIAIRRLPTLVAADPIVAGVCIDADGQPQLVLDPIAVAQSARAARPLPVLPATVRRRPVLVVDDSLTTRMLEQSILESAGYEVAVAASGEEALAKVRTRDFGLLLVDVEMSGIDGFEFVKRTRDDPDLQRIPAILVTSRNAPEDRQRARQVGAHSYIFKGDFDQRVLLDTVRELVGA